MTTTPSLVATLNRHGAEITDADEETFELFTLYRNTGSLGMVAQGAKSIDITISNRDFTIHQSPGLLTSKRDGGTTGAVLWKIAPIFARWLSSQMNFLFKAGILSKDTVALELGAGISPLTGLCLAPCIKRYTLTDQEYVLKLLRQNVEEKLKPASASKSKIKGPKSERPPTSNVEVQALDWETSATRQLIADEDTRPTVLLATDCIFNPAIIEPFVSTLADLSTRSAKPMKSIVSIIAQQLRSSDVFQEWVEKMLKRFRVWRVDDKYLRVGEEGSEQMGQLSVEEGYVVHVCVLRDEVNANT